MSTHNIGFYEDLSKIIFELSSNIIKYATYLFCCLPPDSHDKCQFRLCRYIVVAMLLRLSDEPHLVFGGGPVLLHVFLSSLEDNSLLVLEFLYKSEDHLTYKAPKKHTTKLCLQHFYNLSPSHTFTVLAPVELLFTPIYQIVAHRHDS